MNDRYVYQMNCHDSENKYIITFEQVPPHFPFNDPNLYHIKKQSHY